MSAEQTQSAPTRMPTTQRHTEHAALAYPCNYSLQTNKDTRVRGLGNFTSKDLVVSQHSCCVDSSDPANLRNTCWSFSWEAWQSPKVFAQLPHTTSANTLQTHNLCGRFSRQASGNSEAQLSQARGFRGTTCSLLSRATRCQQLGFQISRAAVSTHMMIN